MNDEQMTQRMRAASDGIAMSESAQARHLEAIASALSEGSVTALTAAGSIRRRRLLASLVAAAVIAPTGLAAASESAVPGDALYGVKQISEKVLVLFDFEVVARHRIEEIEALGNEGRSDPKLLEDAHEALAELDEDHPLWQRFEASTGPEADPADIDPVVSDDDRSDGQDRPAPASTLKVGLPDGSEAVVTVQGDRISDIETPAGWTVTEIDDDELTLRGSAHEVEIDLLDDGTLSLIVTAEFGDSSGDGSGDDHSDANVDDLSEDSPASPPGGDPDDDDDDDDDDDSEDDG